MVKLVQVSEIRTGASRSTFHSGTEPDPVRHTTELGLYPGEERINALTHRLYRTNGSFQEGFWFACALFVE